MFISGSCFREPQVSFLWHGNLGLTWVALQKTPAMTVLKIFSELSSEFQIHQLHKTELKIESVIGKKL
jgi:hypothetical protein